MKTNVTTTWRIFYRSETADL